MDCKTRVVAAEPEQLGVRVQPTSDVSWVLHLMIVDQQEACGYGLPLGPQRVSGEGGVCKHLRPTIDHHFGLISEKTLSVSDNGWARQQEETSTMISTFADL